MTRQYTSQPIKVTKQTFHGPYERGATADDIKTFFGLLPSEKWPRCGMTPIIVQGIVLYVKPLKPKVMVATRYGTRLRRAEGVAHSRLMAVCPTCDKRLSYGRLHQHLTVHAPK